MSAPSQIPEWLTRERLAALPVFYPVPVPAGGGSGVLFGGACLFGGGLVYARFTAAATFVIHNGNDATGTIAGAYQILANQAIVVTAPGMGVYFDSGLYLEMTAGNIQGAFWILPVS